MTTRRFTRVLAAAVAGGLLASCGLAPTPTGHKTSEYFSPKTYGAASPRVIAASAPAPKGGGRYHIGEPYRVAGKTYIPRDNPDYAEVGLASWYGSAFHGRLTANGEVYDVSGLTAAHPTLPLPSYVRVTNLENRRSLVVRVNDRGPFAHDRVIDVSATVAEMLDFKRSGTAKVKVEYLGPAQMDGLDGRKLLASYDAPGAAPRLPAGAFMMAAAPLPRPALRRLPDDAFQPSPAPAGLGEPLVLLPAFAFASPGGDPLGALILGSGLTSSYVEAAPPSPAHRAAGNLARADLARADLASALRLAASKKAAEIGGPPAIVQVGSFSDRTNAERAAVGFERFGRTELRVRQSDERTIYVLCVGLDSLTAPQAVMAAAAEIGLPDAFILQH
ncbi:MAG: septal ring lytic transglycosylase RlpA family protein [Bauldia sp.]